MINSTLNQTPDINKIFAQFKKDTQTSKNNVEVQQNLNTLQQDTFEKKDKKKVARNAAIGLGVMALAYSAFALVKHKDIKGVLPKLAEPFNILKARINPNGFRPKTDILEDEHQFLREILNHTHRLTEKQKEQYLKYIYRSSNFAEEAKALFERHFARYVN